MKLTVLAVLAVLAVILLPTVSAPAAAPEQRPAPRTDIEGFPLRKGVVARIDSARFRHPDGVERIGGSPDGKQLAAAGFEGAVCVWDFGTGKTIRICEAYHLPQGHSVQVWDTAKGVERHSLFDVSGLDHYHFIPCDNPRLLLTCTDAGVRFADLH